MKSTSPAIQSVIDNFREYRDEMLKMLEHPYLPPHNNDREISEVLSKDAKFLEVQKVNRGENSGMD